MTSPLVALTHGEETLAVTRDDNGLCWLGSNGFGSGGRAATTFTDGTWVVGGLLPSMAARAVVRDVAGFETVAACGGGAWIATSSDRQPTVRFETTDGEIVVAPVAAELQPVGPGDFEYVTPPPRSWAPVNDAVDPCPACDALAWTSSDATVRCTRCGHQDDGWVSYVDGAAEPSEREPVDPDEAAASAEWFERTSIRLTLEELRDEPVFVVADAELQPRYSGCGWSGGRTRPTSVAIAHGPALEIETHWDDRHFHLSPGEQALETMLSDSAPWPDVSPPARSIWLHAQDRKRRCAVATAERFTHEVEVDREVVRFTGLRSGDNWSLVGSTPAADVIIRGRTALPGRLRRIFDPVDELTP